MAKISAHISDDNFDKVKELSKRAFKGRPGSWLADLIERELEDARNTTNPSDEDCLVTLTKSFCPTFVREMRETCEGLDQPKALARILSVFAIGESSLSKEFLIEAENLPAPYEKPSKK